MREIIIVGIVCCIASFAVAAFDLKAFNEKIKESCLTRQVGRNFGFRPLANSMESFISMVERIERNHTNWNIYQVSKILIKRFGFDGIKFKNLGGELRAMQDSHYSFRTKIIDKLVDLNSQEEFDENDLNEEEKCSMYYMMGHLVNNTLRDSQDEAIIYQPANTIGKVDVNDHNNGGSVAKHPREQGVVSLNGDPKHAIALGKVLIGIAAAENPKTETIGRLFPEWDSKNFPFLNKNIESIVGVTIADVVSHAALHKGDGGKNMFGNGGEWNNTYCSTEYSLSESDTGSSLATVRGAIDGFLIGNALRKLQNGGSNGRDLTLSKILRMYYDVRGIPLENGAGALGTSYCRRGEFTAVMGSNTQTESTEAFYNAYYVLHINEADSDPNGDSVASQALTSLQQLNGIHNIDDAVCKPSFQNENRCETASNVFVILDDSDQGTTGFEFQQKVIGRLAARLDIGLGAGSMGVYFNARQGGANLQPLVYNATNSAVASCALTFRQHNSIPQSVDEESLMQGLNSTLQDYETRLSEESYSPSKAVVLFKYGEMKMNDEKRVTTAANIVRFGHRDTRVFAVGSNQKTLGLLATDQRDVIPGTNDYERLADTLYDKICEVPSVLQYEQCWNHRNRNEEGNKHTGYVTPDHIQYVAMYPQYFLKSYNVEFKFQAEGLNGEITVCHSRSNANPKDVTTDKWKQCQTTKAEQRELIFRMTDPCHKYHVSNCLPAYFSVAGQRAGGNSRSGRCTDANCRRTDQIKYTITHTGISCNGSGMMKPISVLVVLATIYRMIFKN